MLLKIRRKSMDEMVREFVGQWVLVNYDERQYPCKIRRTTNFKKDRGSKC